MRRTHKLESMITIHWDVQIVSQSRDEYLQLPRPGNLKTFPPRLSWHLGHIFAASPTATPRPGPTREAKTTSPGAEDIDINLLI